MVCPLCASPTSVSNSRHNMSETKVWRRRYCDSCKDAFTTYERFDLSYMIVTKRDGSIEKYARPKLFSSIYRAQLDPLISDDLTDTIETKLLAKRKPLVSSRDIASFVTDTLAAYDKASHARYTSFQR